MSRLFKAVSNDLLFLLTLTIKEIYSKIWGFTLTLIPSPLYLIPYHLSLFPNPLATYYAQNPSKSSLWWVVVVVV